MAKLRVSTLTMTVVVGTVCTPCDYARRRSLQEGGQHSFVALKSATSDQPAWMQWRNRSGYNTRSWQIRLSGRDSTLLLLRSTRMQSTSAQGCLPIGQSCMPIAAWPASEQVRVGIEWMRWACWAEYGLPALLAPC